MDIVRLGFTKRGNQVGESQKYGTRRQKAKAETRRVILETAYSLFEKKGYQKTTMRELAAKAGVGLGTIFQHFPEKSALMVAAFEEDLEAEVNRAFDELPDVGIRDQLIHFSRRFYSYYAQRPQLFRVLFNEISFVKDATETRIDTLIFRFWDRLEALFHKAVERGEIRATVDTSKAVMAFWAYYSFSLYYGLRMPEFDAEFCIGLFQELMDQHLNGIKA
jgi:AcrR family transcriptional regulator